MSWPRGCLVLFLAIDLASRLWLALGPLARLDTPLLDDAFLSLTVARNIGAGLGPLYGLLPTNGFQPLYVFLCAPLFAVLPGQEAPIHAALVLLTVCDAASLALLWGLLRRHTQSLWGPASAATLWIALPYVIATTMNGLETTLAFMLVLAVVSAADRWLGNSRRELRPSAAFGLGLLFGLAMMARIDAGFLGLALALVAAYRWLRGHLHVPELISALAAAMLGFAIVYGPWVLYSLVWTGAALPVSGQAVRWLSLSDPHTPEDPGLVNFHLPLLLHGLTVWWRHQAIPILAVGALLAWAIARQTKGAVASLGRLLAVPALFCLLLWLAYAFYVLAPWYWDRYMFVALLPLLLAVGLLADLTIGRLPTAGRGRAGSGLLLVLVGACLSRPALHDLYAPQAGAGYLRIGRYARDHLPAGTRIGATQSGAIGYFAPQVTVVNLDGVVNGEALRAQQQQRLLDYARASGVTLVLGWDQNLRMLLDRSTGATPADLIVGPAIEGVDTYGQRWHLAHLTP